MYSYYHIRARLFRVVVEITDSILTAVVIQVLPQPTSKIVFKKQTFIKICIFNIALNISLLFSKKAMIVAKVD